MSKRGAAVERNERMRQLRADRGETQMEVARKLGMHVSQYNMIENGKRAPTLEQAMKIASYFGTTVEDLFSGLVFHSKSDTGGAARSA